MAATADIALLLLFLGGIVFGIASISAGAFAFWKLPKGFLRSWDDWRYNRSLHEEQLKQERLRTALLEEQLRNEVMKKLLDEEAGSRSPPPKTPDSHH